MNKKLFTILCGTLLAQAGMSAPLFCNGDGWSLTTNSTMQTAKLTYQGSELTFGDLKCQGLATTTFPPTYHLLCKSTGVADAGYSFGVILKSPGTNMIGKLSEITIAGGKNIATLNCVQALDEEN